MLLALVLTAGCGAPRDPARPLSGAAPPGPGFATAISSAGVGPLGPRTPDDRDAIARLFPGLTVEASLQLSDGHEVAEYTIQHRGARALFVVMNRYRPGDDKMFRIDVFDPMFATATGIATGATVGALAAKHPDTTCQFQRYDPGADIYEVEQRLYCETAALPHVTFELDPEGWRDAPGPVPAARLAGRTVDEITWVNPE